MTDVTMKRDCIEIDSKELAPVEGEGKVSQQDEEIVGDTDTLDSVL